MKSKVEKVIWVCAISTVATIVFLMSIDIEKNFR